MTVETVDITRDRPIILKQVPIILFLYSSVIILLFLNFPLLFLQIFHFIKRILQTCPLSG